MKTFYLGLCAILFAVGGCATGNHTQTSPSPMPCAELAGVQLDDTVITATEVIRAGGFSIPVGASPSGERPYNFSALPPFCRVTALVSPVQDSLIEFELWLPEDNWNGNFVGVGDGGLTGAIFYSSMAEPLRQGYAVANTDGGHKGGGADTAFAVGHPEKLIDHAWRAVHLMTVRSKSLVQARYGRPAGRALWTGCSTGGRQGLKSAQQFPEDYDAIAAAAPANNWMPLITFALLVQRQLTDPEKPFDARKVSLLSSAAIKACDLQDGVADGVVNEPQRCRFDPGVLACTGEPRADCLTSHEVAAARTIYAGVVDPRSGKTIFAGPEPGSEVEWPAFTPGAFPIGENFLRDIVFPERNWDIQAFDFGADLDEAIRRDPAELTATDPDLSAFIERGGKLLLYHGWIDGLIPAQSTIDYYNAVQASVGRESGQSVRLFMVPGLHHCDGGAGASEFNELSVLESWLANDNPPERITVSKTLDDGSPQTRPLCAHPKVARYAGSGAKNKAESFHCR